MKGQVGKSDLAGHLELSTSGPRPSVSGNLSSGVLDLAALLVDRQGEFCKISRGDPSAVGVVVILAAVIGELAEVGRAAGHAASG